MFAELDAETVTSVDCDGMIFDPTNFKAMREVSQEIQGYLFFRTTFSGSRLVKSSYTQHSIFSCFSSVVESVKRTV